MADLIHYDRTANRLRNAVMNYISSNKTLPTIPDTGRALDLLEKYYMCVCVEKHVHAHFVPSYETTVCTRKYCFSPMSGNSLLRYDWIANKSNTCESKISKLKNRIVDRSFMLNDEKFASTFASSMTVRTQRKRYGSVRKRTEEGTNRERKNKNYTRRYYRTRVERPRYTFGLKRPHETPPSDDQWQPVVVERIFEKLSPDRVRINRGRNSPKIERIT